MPSDEHPQSHPNRPLFLDQLAAAYFERDGMSDEIEDLNNLIQVNTSLPLDHPTRTKTLLELSFALLHRLKKYKSGELDEVNITIKYLRMLHNCPLEAFNVPHDAVTASLVEMLAFRVGREAGDGREDIHQVLFLCRGLVLGTSPGYITSASQALTQAVLDTYSRGKQIQSLDDAIGCLREALKTCSPELHQVSFDLANLLAVRFLVHHVHVEYKEAKELLDRITTRTPPCLCHCQAVTLTTALKYGWLIANSGPEDSETEASRCRSFLENLANVGRPLHPVIVDFLGSRAKWVSKHVSPPQAVQGPHSEIACVPISTQLPVCTTGDGVDTSDIVPVLLPMPLISRLQSHYLAARPGTDDQRRRLTNLVRFYNGTISNNQDTAMISENHDMAVISENRDTTFIDEGIKYNKELLLSSHPSDNTYFLHLSSFATFLYSAFKLTKNVKYLDYSISQLREVFKLDGAQQTHFVTTRRLIECLDIRWQRGGRQNESPDLVELMDLFVSGVKDTYAMVPNRFDLACHWANTAQISGHHSLSTAYDKAMSLMQSSLVFTPTLSYQFNRLVERREFYEKTPLNFASHHIRAERLERAVEVLEHGRALIWSEMRGLRTSTDQLNAVDPDLANRFTAINQELEEITTSANDNGLEGHNMRMKRQCALLTKRNSLIPQIRGFPGLEDFSSPLSFDTLRSATSHGPVIIINHCELGSDIIIVLHDSPPSRIPTPPDFFERANQLKDRLLRSRNDFGLSSKKHEDALSVVLMEHTLSDVLKELYELVGLSVIRKFIELGIPEQSRVWWCPTSAFWYLPLHAMGPIPSDNKDIRYFSDLYISSYSPTLSALITSRRPGTQTSARPTLLVGQSSQSPPGAWEDTLVIRGLDLPTTILPSGNMTPTTVLDGLRRNRFAFLPYDVARETEDPFDAAMLFHNERLTLLDILQSRHSAGEFAFLPCSLTAQVGDECIPDEVLHFSAALQFSGFRSVIGTMWEMDDEDGRNLAKYVYKSMFSKELEESGEPYYERSARALRHAVQVMRASLPMVRWVNFVHYGA
jgi:hypothetical protein